MGLPNLLTHVAPLVRLARWSSAIIIITRRPLAFLYVKSRLKGAEVIKMTFSQLVNETFTASQKIHSLHSSNLVGEIVLNLLDS